MVMECMFTGPEGTSVLEGSYQAGYMRYCTLGRRTRFDVVSVVTVRLVITPHHRRDALCDGFTVLVPLKPLGGECMMHGGGVFCQMGNAEKGRLVSLVECRGGSCRSCVAV